MTPEEFRAHAHEFVDWMADYMAGIEDYPVRARTAPGDIAAKLPDAAPEMPEAMADIFGYDGPEELIGLGSPSVLVAPEELERLKGYACDRIAGREVPTEYTYHGIRKDGRSIWLETTARLTEWKGGTAIQLTNVDITERLEAERELRESRALLQTVFDTIPVWLHVKDRDSRFRLVNRKMAQDIGVLPEEMIDRPHDQAPSTPAAGPDRSVCTASRPAARAARMPPLERKTDSRAPGNRASRR